MLELNLCLSKLKHRNYSPNCWLAPQFVLGMQTVATPSRTVMANLAVFVFVPLPAGPSIAPLVFKMLNIVHAFYCVAACEF